MGIVLGLGLLMSAPVEHAVGAETVPELLLVTWTKSQYPIQYEIAIMLAESWGELGLEVKVDPVNFPNPLVERVFVTHDFDAAVISFTAQLQRLDPEFLHLQHVPHFPGRGGRLEFFGRSQC